MTERTEAKHTPGPWRAYFVEGEPITNVIQPGRRQDEWRIDPFNEGNGVSIIASIHGPDMEANARLISAAPELLAELKRCYDEDYSQEDSAYGVRRAAEIAKLLARIEKAGT